MDPIIYKVTITPYSVSGANQGGFLDNKTVQQYGLIPGLTYDQCQDKRRANLRWVDIMESLAFEANPVFQNIQAIGAAVDTPATSFYFEVYYTADGMPSTNRNGTLLTGTDCIQQWVAEALINDSNDQCEVFDPTMTDEISDKFHMNGIVTSHIAVGSRFIILSIGRLADTVDLAKANITVTV
jgi:hypothetical protein